MTYAEQLARVRAAVADKSHAWVSEDEEAVAAVLARLDALEARIAEAVKLTDTGSNEYKATVGQEVWHTPGWRIVEKIREVLLG